MSGKGYRVAVIKHDGHEFEGDVPGTDSYKLYNAGAAATVIFSDSQLLIHKRQSLELEQIIDQFAEYDLVIIEGSKKCNYNNRSEGV